MLLHAAGANAKLPNPAQWEFEVMLDEKTIGYHNFTVSADEGIQTITTEAQFDVKLLFVNVYSYTHQNREVWQDDCLTAISAETDANGKDFTVRGQVDDGEFQIETQSRTGELPACIMSYAYWNPEILSADKLLNSQTGQYESVYIEEMGEEVLEINGAKIRAIKYSLAAAAGPISLWYAADDNRWLALESVMKGGRVLRYKPTNLPTAET